MVIRSGYVKFWRLGPVEFGEQSRWGRAPRSRGLWAFPYPFYDSFFTYHKYLDLLPKSLQGEGVDWEEREKWINTVGRKVLPIREFWYQGDVFTHFLPNSDIRSSEDYRFTSWSVMDAAKLTRVISSNGADKAFYRSGDKVLKVQSSVDHLEVFIAPNMGRLRGGSKWPSKGNHS